MEIERINENTIKFYISYIDIENLGYEKEEIWYNRERSEQLFWHMMDEVNHKEDFNPEGPLWIQVQAMDKGLEVIVTKAKLQKQDENYHLDNEGDADLDLTGDGQIEDILDDTFGKSISAGKESDDESGVHEEKLWMTFDFDEFEDAIQLSHFMQSDYEIQEETLYHYKDKYYLYIQFSIDVLEEEKMLENLTSKILEFANDSNISLHVLEEYGKVIIKDNTFTTLSKHFPVQK